MILCAGCAHGRKRHRAARSTLACDLTSLLSVRVASEFSLGGLADVVALCGPAVDGTGWPSGTGFAGFRRTGRAGGRRADVPEIPADPGGGEPARSGGAFPRPAPSPAHRPRP